MYKGHYVYKMSLKSTEPEKITLAQSDRSHVHLMYTKTTNIIQTKLLQKHITLF